jgi:hypothetical protein
METGTLGSMQLSTSEDQIIRGCRKGGYRGGGKGGNFTEMKIYGGEMTGAQIEAGLAAMQGRHFTGTKVMSALKAAGVKNCVSAAEQLLSREVRNGRVRKVTRGIYEPNPDYIEPTSN